MHYSMCASTLFHKKCHDTMSILYDNIQTSALLLNPNVMVLMNKKQVVSHAVCSKL